ncbi:MAG TPA: crossover junction endodeoxyribonuclease RuvC [Polyangiaceae bacterium]|nr:crossover junction endodeoxyribonuclease RuvC [Polyangiaceae bacterium]
MLIVGIDPGTLHLGWGVIRTEGTKLVHVDHGIIHTNPDDELARRLVTIDDGLEEMLREHRPEQGAVEALFFAKDAQAAAKLGHARGVALLRLVRAGVSIHEYPPARVKRALAGNGQADKHQVGMMVKTVLGLREVPGVDASDALAVAITHARVAKFDETLRAGGVKLR